MREAAELRAAQSLPAALKGKWSTVVVAGIALAAIVSYAAYRYLAEHRTRRISLQDGTVVVLYGRSVVTPVPGFPRPRTVRVNGEALFEASSADEPMIVTSRLLRLTVEGSAKFLVMADAAQSGAQVQVIHGALTAEKNYASPYKEPDHLREGEMSMVNISIDLMEKEHFTAMELPPWVSKAPN